MAKKKQLPANSDQSAVDNGPKITATATPYTVGLWAGKKQWRCLLCAFDTLDENAMFEHIDTHRLGLAQVRTDDDIRQDRDGETDVFEVELEEIDSTKDELGNDHKVFTIKE